MPVPNVDLHEQTCATATILVWKTEQITSSNGVALEAPIIAFRLLKHLPKGAFPFTGLFILFLDPERNLHHAPRDVPITPQRLNSLIIISWAGGLVEQWAPCILVLANKLNLFERILRFPLLHFLPNLTNCRFRRDRHRKHAQGRQNFNFGDMVLITLSNLSCAFLDQPTLLIPDLTVRCCVFGEDDLLSFFFSHF